MMDCAFFIRCNAFIINRMGYVLISIQDVINTSEKAIDDAKEGGRFILSTGDQRGRDTPFENLFAMVETARTYGRY